MMEILKHWDTTLFLFLNSKHNDFFDVVMFWISKGYFWIPVYLLFLYFMIKYYKYKTIYIILAYALLITLTDQVSVQLFKNFFHRLRPCHEPAIEGIVHTVNGYCGGDYGFVSSHASNFFGFTTLTILLLRKKIKYLSVILIIWASTICYTRIYLGVHYPGDILGGALVGIILAFGVYKLYSFLSIKNLLKKESQQDSG